MMFNLETLLEIVNTSGENTVGYLHMPLTFITQGQQCLKIP